MTNLIATNFTFALTDNMQDVNPGYGVWMASDRQSAIIQTNDAHFIPCRRNRSGSLQGLHAYVAATKFDVALADLNTDLSKDTSLDGPKFKESGDVREASRLMFDPSFVC
jgi:hypothetical protein